MICFPFRDSMDMEIPRYWRLQKQRYKLEGIEKVDQEQGIGLAHMRSSSETLNQVVKNIEASKKAHEQADAVALEEVRKKIHVP